MTDISISRLTMPTVAVVSSIGLALFAGDAIAQEHFIPIIVPAPTFAEQIVPIAVAIATALGIVSAAVVPIVITVVKMIRELKTDVAALKPVVADLAHNTNSIKDALVATTKSGALAEGNLAGRKELKDEIASGGTVITTPPVAP